MKLQSNEAHAGSTHTQQTTSTANNKPSKAGKEGTAAAPDFPQRLVLFHQRIGSRGIACTGIGF